MRWCTPLLPFIAAILLGQTGGFPLESVTLTGTAFSPAMVEQLGGLRIGAPVDKASIEKACRQLQQSGLFASVEYQYAPGPKHGYALTLKLADSPANVSAAIDVPGVNEGEAWEWLSAKYPAFNRRVPEVEAAQQFVAGELERHLTAELEGQHVVARLESDLKTRRNRIVFQPEVLPQIASLTFNHVQEFRSDELEGMLRKVMGTEGYSERRFHEYLEGVVRQAYEEHGMYRVAFPAVHMQKSGKLSVMVATDVSEGAKFSLGDVQIVEVQGAGDSLPVDAMLRAAKFESGKLANWREIQQKIYALEKPVKRIGYYTATARPERLLHDEQRVLDLRIGVALGPLFHFGQLSFSGLSPDDEERARRMWKMQAGDAYDYGYFGDFFGEYARKVDLRSYKVRNQPRAGAGEHVIDETVLFERR